MSSNKTVLILVQLVGLFLLLWVGALALVIGGTLLALAYHPFVLRDKLLKGTGGEQIFCIVMIIGWAYVIYKIMEAKGWV